MGQMPGRRSGVWLRRCALSLNGGAADKLCVESVDAAVIVDGLEAEARLGRNASVLQRQVMGLSRRDHEGRGEVFLLRHGTQIDSIDRDMKSTGIDDSQRRFSGLLNQLPGQTGSRIGRRSADARRTIEQLDALTNRQLQRILAFDLLRNFLNIEPEHGLFIGRQIALAYIEYAQQLLAIRLHLGQWRCYCKW